MGLLDGFMSSIMPVVVALALAVSTGAYFAGRSHGFYKCQNKVNKAKVEAVEKAQETFKEHVELRAEVDRESQKLAEKSRERIAIDNADRFKRMRDLFTDGSRVSTIIRDSTKADDYRAPDSAQGGGGDADTRARITTLEDYNREAARQAEVILKASQSFRLAALECASDVGIEGKALQRIEGAN
jgi:hypothetical protein